MTDFDEPEHTERTVVERRDPMIGCVLDGRYRVEFRLAAGGFGAIYRATDLATHTDVAVKVLHGALASDDSVVERFRREGETIAKLRDPHTVSALAVGETGDGVLYIVMELLHGESLYERYRAGGAMPWKRVATIARAVCTSLAEAHALGIVHRDLKPANIHLERRGDERDFVKVVDFGIAKLLLRPDLTHAGQMIGTFDYMAPEQMIGGRCSGAVDIYTLGVVMYEMIAGVRPFGEHNNPTSQLSAILTTVPMRLASRAILPVELDDIVMRCLEREQHKRFTDVAELAAALDRLLHDDDADRVTRAITAETPAPAPVPRPARGSRQVVPIQGSAPIDANGVRWEAPPRFELSANAARDARVRRFVWICALVLALAIAAIVAAHM